MKEEKMYVPSGLKTVDGKDIMCYTGVFYLKNKEKIDKMLKKCEEILREEEQKSKEFKGKNENIIREETEKYYINQKHDKMFKEMLSDKKSTVDFINSFLHLNLVEDDIEKYEKEFRTSEFSNVEADVRSEEHTSELQSPRIISYAVFCLKKKNFFNDTATTEIYTLSLHDALSISFKFSRR